MSKLEKLNFTEQNTVCQESFNKQDDSKQSIDETIGNQIIVNIFFPNLIALKRIAVRQESQVQLVMDQPTKETFVLKITKKIQGNCWRNEHQKFQLQFCRLLMQKKFNHLISIKGIQEHQKHVICSMQYGCRGNLRLFVEKASNLRSKSEKIQHMLTIKNIVWQVIQGLNQIHSLGYIFRDLKPENILLSHDGKIKICDFGLVSIKGSVDSSLCGTPQYMAPERLTDKRNSLAIEESIDYWSLGVLTYELLMGHTPFCYEDNVERLIDQIFGQYITFDKDYPAYCKHFVFNLLQPNRKRRMNRQKVRNHQFFSDYSEINICPFPCNCL